MRTYAIACPAILLVLCLLSIISIFMAEDSKSQIVSEYACVKNYSFIDAERVPILGLEHTRDICPSGTEMVRLK
jgi:hypothetical protein